jgi:hypothetical protein
MRRLLATVAAILVSTSISHAFTISVSGDGDRASYTGADLGLASSFDPDLSVAPFGSLPTLDLGSNSEIELFPSFTLTANGYTQKFDVVAIDRGVNSLDVALFGNMFIGGALVGAAIAEFDLTQPGGPGNRVLVSFSDFGFGLDHSPVGASPAPEASTWAMMALGFLGLAGLGARRKARYCFK